MEHLLSFFCQKYIPSLLLGLVEIVNKHRLFKRLVATAKQWPSGAAHPQPEEKYEAPFVSVRQFLLYIAFIAL
jgi:hypothetical protein